MKRFPRPWEGRDRKRFPRRPRALPPGGKGFAVGPICPDRLDVETFAKRFRRSSAPRDVETFRVEADGETFFRDLADGETFYLQICPRARRGNLLRDPIEKVSSWARRAPRRKGFAVGPAAEKVSLWSPRSDVETFSTSLT